MVVAAASRTVLIAVLPSFGAPPQQSEAMALVEEACRTALADIPDGWPSKMALPPVGLPVKQR